jgi:hypothetical protein
MIFWLIILFLLFILILMMIDYFLLSTWTKSMEKSIDEIFDKLSKTTIIVFILSIFGLNDEDKNNDNNDNVDNNINI